MLLPMPPIGLFCMGVNNMKSIVLETAHSAIVITTITTYSSLSHPR